MIKSLSSFFEAQTPRGGQAACYLSVRAAAQGAPGGKFPYFRLRPAENGRSPLNHAAAARPPCTKPYNHPKIMQIYSFFALARAAARYHTATRSPRPQALAAQGLFPVGTAQIPPPRYQTATRKRRRALRGKENQFS